MTEVLSEPETEGMKRQIVLLNIHRTMKMADLTLLPADAVLHHLISTAAL